MKQTVRLFAVSDEDFAVQRFYTDKIKEAGFDVQNLPDDDGNLVTYIDNFNFEDLPKLMARVDEDLIVSAEINGYSITIYDLPLC